MSSENDTIANDAFTLATALDFYGLNILAAFNGDEFGGGSNGNAENKFWR